jgi:IS1 family transposase
MTSWWAFPPETQEIQFDEKWSFVHKKQKNCDPDDPEDANCGDCWDHVAFDPEHRLVLAVVPGARTIENTEAIVEEVKDRLGEEPPRLITTDEYAAYESAIEHVFGQPVELPPVQRPGRHRILPKRELPKRLIYATVRKQREGHRVVSVERKLVFGTERGLERALKRSKVSSQVNTSFLERQNGTDRGRNGRKARKTYRFSKDWEIHESMTYFTLYSSNFCWPVRTLRVKKETGGWQERSPAMAAGLTDHVWTWREWFSFPAFQSP